MVSKYLVSKIKIGPRRNDAVKPIKLEYYLLESEIGYISELAGKKVYGIGIVQKTTPDCMKEERILNFSCCRESTKNVLQKLAVNTVTPMELPFILEDMLGV